MNKDAQFPGDTGFCQRLPAGRATPPGLRKTSRASKGIYLLAEPLNQTGHWPFCSSGFSYAGRGQPSTSNFGSKRGHHHMGRWCVGRP